MKYKDYILERKRYWNEIGVLKESTTSLDMDLFLQFVKKESRILDYGCGYGRTLSELLNNGYVNLYGVDISVSMIN